MGTTSRVLSLVSVIGAVILSSWAGAQPAPQTPTFASSTNLVLVPVLVRRGGHHIPHLQKNSFVLLQDGQAQKIALFEEVRTTTERLKWAAVSPGEFTNELAGDPSSARYTVIAIDRVNTTPEGMYRLREGLLKFLGQAAASREPIRLVGISSSGVQVIQDFTTDPKVLAKALQAMQTPAGREQPGNPMLHDYIQYMDAQAELMGDGDRARALRKSLDGLVQMDQSVAAARDRSARIDSLAALREIALSLVGLPGRKSLIWASAGYPFSGTPVESRQSGGTGISWGASYDFSHVGEALGMDEYTTHLLNAANVAMYPVDVRGPVNTAYDAMDPTHKYSPSYAEKEITQLRNQDVIATFEHLADITGGKPCYGRADVSGCFRTAMDDAHDYYLLGFYVGPKQLKPGWHKLRVRVAEKGVSVRARNGFLYSTLTPDSTKRADLGLDLTSQLINPGLPFRGRWTDITPKEDKKSVGVQLTIPGSAGVVTTEQPKMNLEIAALARRGDGSVAAQFAQHVERSLGPDAIGETIKTGVIYKNALELAPGRYSVRFVVRDNNSGRMGALTTLLVVE